MKIPLIEDWHNRVWGYGLSMSVWESSRLWRVSSFNKCDKDECRIRGWWKYIITATDMWEKIYG